MRMIDLKEIDVLDYIKEHIHSIKLNSRRIEDAKFHHNTSMMQLLIFVSMEY